MPQMQVSCRVLEDVVSLLAPFIYRFTGPAACLRNADELWQPLNISFRTSLLPLSMARLRHQPLQHRPLIAPTTSWTPCRGCGQSLSKASWTGASNVRNAIRTWVNMPGKECNVVAAAGLSLASACQRVE